MHTDAQIMDRTKKGHGTQISFQFKINEIEASEILLGFPLISETVVTLPALMQQSFPV